MLESGGIVYRPLLFIAADRREADPWVTNWDNPHPLSLPVHWARAGKWRNRDVIAIANGVGVQRATAAIEAARAFTEGFSGICSIRTSPHIARTSAEKKNLHDSGAIIVEMEAAGVAHVAQELAVPFYCVRVVSDLEQETFFFDFESFLTPDGRFHVPSLIMKALAHPVKGFSELLRLQRRTSEAAKQLGGFLAKCDFRYD